MDNELQTKDIEENNENRTATEPEEESSEKPEVAKSEKVTKERIERVKKAFKPTWLDKILNSQEDKKGK